MINTILVQTTQGAISMPVMHKNRALQVIQAPTYAEGIYFYNTVHDNGLELPKTDTDVLENAIKICDWCAENFPEFTKVDLDISKVPTARKEEFKCRLERFRFVELRDWERDYD